MTTKNLITAILLSMSCAVFGQAICNEEIILYTDGTNYFAIPNVFTPDDDGLNDLLTIYHAPVKQVRLVFTNLEYGTETRRIDSTEGIWDGLDDYGEPAPEGAYNLTLNFLFENDGVEIACRTVYLIRQNCIALNGDSITLNFPIDYNAGAMFFDPTTTNLPQTTPEECISSNIYGFKQNMKIYPNPVSDVLYLENINEVENISIFNVNGKQIFSKQNYSIDTSINLSHLTDGVYVIIFYNDENTRTKRIVIQGN